MTTEFVGVDDSTDIDATRKSGDDVVLVVGEANFSLHLDTIRHFESDGISLTVRNGNEVNSVALSIGNSMDVAFLSKGDELYHDGRHQLS